jgi:hypothetical protein
MLVIGLWPAEEPPYLIVRSLQKGRTLAGRGHLEWAPCPPASNAARHPGGKARIASSEARSSSNERIARMMSTMG